MEMETVVWISPLLFWDGKRGKKRAVLCLKVDPRNQVSKDHLVWALVSAEDVLAVERTESLKEGGEVAQKKVQPM